MGKTVYVVGAGASKEAKLPTGNELLSIIKSLLDIRFQRGHLDGGDEEIAYALAIQAEHQQCDISQLRQAAWQVRDNMDLAASIDNFIDSRRGDRDIELCGKLAIASAILSAERRSILYTKNNARLNFGGLDQTWYMKLCRSLVAGCDKADLALRLRELAFVIFNYDRCVEHFIFHFLRAYYAFEEKEAADLVRSIEIHHPYGTTGPIPLPGGEHISFGQHLGPGDLLKVAGTLRTFTEADKASGIDDIRALMASSSRIVFVGFGFLGLNMDLLQPVDRTRQVTPRRVFGSVMGFSEADQGSIRQDIADRFSAFSDHVQLVNLNAGATLSHYSHGLRFA